MTRKPPIFRLKLIKHLVRLANHGNPALPWTQLCRALTRPSKRQWAGEFDPVFTASYPRWLDFALEDTPDAQAFKHLRAVFIAAWLTERPAWPESSGGLRAWASSTLTQLRLDWVGAALTQRYREWERNRDRFDARACRNVVIG